MKIYDRPISNGREHIAQDFLTALLEWETSDASSETSPAGVAVLSAVAMGQAAEASAPAPLLAADDRETDVSGAEAAVAG